MSRATYRISKPQRSLRQRLFEPPAVGKMSPMANLVAWAILLFWSLFVLFPDRKSTRLNSSHRP